MGSLRAASLLVLAVALAGCAGIPTAGPVVEGAEVQAGVDDPFIRVLPRPPAAGLEPAEVVRGFLAASASFEDDHAVARLYLTPEAAASWDATSGVTVYDDDRGITVTADGAAVEVAADAEAAIDADGLLSPGRRRPVRLDFGLERSGREWRIASLPDGLLLSRTDVARAFRPFDLYFLSPEGDRLVPDPVFIPLARPGAATSLVRALIDGPTPWLAPAVRTAFPEGTTTVVDAVPVENGVAAVDLSAEALGADEQDRQRMAAQLVWTLTQLPEVTAVRLTVEGSPLPLPQPGPQTPSQWSTYAPDGVDDDLPAYLVLRGAVARYVDGVPQPVPGAFGSGALDLVDPTATPSGGAVAALTRDRRMLLLTEATMPDQVRQVLTGRSLSPPSFDGYGRLWVADRDGDGSLVRVRLSDGRVRRVVAPALEDRQVVQLRLAADGTRAAVLLARRDGSGLLLLARVVRTGDVVQLDALRRIERHLADVRDVAWAGSDRLVVLGRRSGAVLQPYSVGVDGSLTQAGGSLPGIVGLAAAAGRPLLASTADGRVWQDTGLGWRALGRGRYPAYPG